MSDQRRAWLAAEATGCGLVSGRSVSKELANQTGLKITVCHFPPGASKWNFIEHRLFCHITKNWRGHPLESLAIVVNLIAHTTATTGYMWKPRSTRKRILCASKSPRKLSIQ
jgi:hypothetical protein